MGSETGVIEEDPANIKRRGRLQPGKIFLVDLDQGRIVEDGEVKAEVASRRPYGRWFAQGVVHLADLPEREPRVPREEPLRNRPARVRLQPGGPARPARPDGRRRPKEPVGSMGNDIALAVLSDKSPPLFAYFKQLFAQVTNPPVDPIREDIVMSVATGVGSERNLLAESPEHAHQLAMEQPILRSPELEKLRQVDSSVFQGLHARHHLAGGGRARGPRAALERTCAEAEEVLEDGVNILILSDRCVGAERVAIPSLLAVAAVHHHLVRTGTRLQAGLVLESGEPREVHHFATLLGYGAAAINPYVMLESLAELHANGRLPEGLSLAEAERNVVKGIGKGLLKTISKMGISTIQSYNGAQIFEAVGLEPALIDRYFTGTASRHRRCRPGRARARGARAPREGLPAQDSTTRPRSTCSPTAACTPGAATASTGCGARTRSPSSSTPSATAAGRPTRSSPRR
jgi:hypothetical protein